jgi:pentatricopeptide repeat protein
VASHRWHQHLDLSLGAEGLGRGAEWGKAFEFYDEMRANGLSGNTVTYNTVLFACAKCCSMGHASKWLEDGGATWVEPDIITYSTIVMG